MQCTTVVLIDDHDMLRAGVRDYLGSFPEYEVVGEAATGTDGLQVVAETQPDIVLVDIAMPGMDGIIATREILRRAPRARVVVLSAHKHIQEVVDVLDAGAVGYVLKADPPETLMRALGRAARNTPYLAPAIAGVLGSPSGRRMTGNVLDVLSEREREIFRLSADCLTAAEIARDLGLARKTVEAHLNRINRKLGLRDRADLVKLAVSLGVVRALRRLPSAARADGAAGHAATKAGVVRH